MAILNRNKQAFPVITSWFDDFFADDLEIFKNQSSIPKVNISENETEYILELAVAGMKKEDFNIDLDKNILTISAEAKVDKKDESSNYTKREFYFNDFKRIFTLPETADAEKIFAEYKDGILKISISKKPEAQTKPVKKIKIK